MHLLLALALAAEPGLATRLPPVPPRLWSVAWEKQLVDAPPLEWKAREPAGPVVDPVTGHVALGTRDGLLRLFDPDGRLVWSFQGGARFESPPRVDGDVIYAGCNDGKLYALELATGKLRWKYDAQEEVGTTPVVAGDLVLVMTLQDNLVAVDRRTGAWKWHHRRESREGFTVRGAAPVVLSGGLAFGAYSDGFVAALDVTTGTVRWERKVAPAGDFVDVDGLRAASGRLYAAAYSGAVYALEVETGRQVWEAKLASPSRLVLGGGLVVAVTNTQVVAFGTDGQQRWSAALQGAPGGDPLVVAGLVAVPNGAALLWFDAASGRLVRALDPGTGVTAGPAGLGQRVYLLSNGGTLVALDLT